MLLCSDDAPPVRVVNARAGSRLLLIGDHAGNRIPIALGTLGLSEAERLRHIAWDIGIAGLGELLADALDATFIHQRYSRLVVDCNRGPDAKDAVPEVSDGTTVPGNAALSEADRAERFAEIHEPYQQAIGAELARREAAGEATLLVALHSFTPVMRGFQRPWHTGVLHHLGRLDFAHATLAALRTEGDLVVGDNEPYQMDGTDYTVPRHAYPSRPYAEIEIRQDLLQTDWGREEWCGRLVRVLTRATEKIA